MSEEKLVDARGLDAALTLFTRTFVIEDKRKQMHDRLRTRERRAETLVALPRWLAGRSEPLAGKDKSPAGLAARLGPLVGVYLDEAGARRIPIARTLELARGSKPALWIGDSGRVALVMQADGPPLLLSSL